MAYDFFDGITSEWIGEYLDNHKDVPSSELFEQLFAQYGELVNSTDAANENETEESRDSSRTS